MINRRVLNLLAVLNLVGLCFVSANLVIYEKPSFLHYHKHDSLRLSDMNNLLLATTGVSVEEEIIYKGLTSTDPIKTPKAVILVLINDPNFDISALNKQTIQIIEDTAIDFDTFRFGSNQLVQMTEEIPDNIDAKMLQDNCKKTIIYIIKATGDDLVSLSSSLDKLVSTFTSECGADSVLVQVLSLSTEIKRFRRDAQPVAAGGNSISNSTIAIFYSDQYPAIFNIIFWSALLLALAVFGISYMMWNMDPGLDTVIYRMTSQRIKKDQ